VLKLARWIYLRVDLLPACQGKRVVYLDGYFEVAMYLKTDDKRKLFRNRLSRIEGQIRGINAMVEQENDCREVLRQLTAVRASIQSTTRFFLESVVEECSNPSNEDRLSQQEITAELLELIASS
jgi:DNA-binding FrmR family transcriptional regulator